MLRRDDFEEMLESVAAINVSQETSTQKFDKIQDRKRRRVDELYAARPRPRYDNEYLGTHGVSSEYAFTDQDIEDIKFDETLIRNNLQNENTEIMLDDVLLDNQPIVSIGDVVNQPIIHTEDDVNRLGENSANRRINVRMEIMETAFEERIKTFRIYNIRHKDPKRFLEESREHFRTTLTELLLTYPTVKLGSLLVCDFKKMENDYVIEQPKYFQTHAEVISVTSDFTEWFMECVMSRLLGYLENFTEEGSGWALVSISYLEFRVNKFSPLNGSSYIDLPPEIKNKRACLNVVNIDNQCFKYAVLAGLFFNPEHDGKRHSKQTREHNNTLVSYYEKYKNKLDMTGISYPVKIHEIQKFERQNMKVNVNGKIANISVNVYVLNMDVNRTLLVSPIHMSKQRYSSSHHVNLLLHHRYDLYQTASDELAAILRDSTFGNSNIHYHFSYIKNMSALVSKQISNHNGARLICDRCINHFKEESVFKAHIKMCKHLNKVAIRMPTEKQKKLSFRNYKNKKRKPFVIYADTETFLKKMAPDEENRSKTHKIQKHEVYG